MGDAQIGLVFFYSRLNCWCHDWRVVGLVLLMVERRVAEGRRRVEVRLRRRRIVQPLLLVLQRPEYARNFDTVSPINRKWQRALSIIEGSELDSWHELEPTDLTSALLRFRSAIWDLREDADDLGQAIARWRAIHERVEGASEFATARILGANEQYLRERFPTARVASPVVVDSDRMRENRLVKRHERKHRKAARRVDRMAGVVLDELVELIRDGKASRGIANAS